MLKLGDKITGNNTADDNIYELVFLKKKHLLDLTSDQEANLRYIDNNGVIKYTMLPLSRLNSLISDKLYKKI